MNEQIDQLLQPVSLESPCGPDLSYDPRFDEIEALLKGKPEVEMGSVKREAEPPEWAQLKAACLEFLRHSKHLRVAVILSCCTLKVDGLPGFAQALRFIRTLLEQYWAQFHPLLDPEDNNDPQQRLNILSGLTIARKATTGWTQVIDYLYTTPLCRPKGAAPICLDDVIAAAKRKETAEGETSPGPDSSQLAALFRGANTDEIQANYNAAALALEQVSGIDEFLTSTLGSGGTISFEDLASVLRQIHRTLSAYLPAASGETATGPGGESGDALATGQSGGTGTAPGGFAGIPITGSIRSRDDVLRALDAICTYYQQVEPGSPVPFLLRRAQRLVTMSFPEAVQELNLATLDQLRPSMGCALDGLPSSTTSETPPAETQS